VRPERGQLAPGAAAALAAGLALLLFTALAVFLVWPPISDVTTTPDDPPRFRATPPGDVEYPSRSADLQTRAYPELAPLGSPDSVGATFQRALETARGMARWTIVLEDSAGAALQAVAETPLPVFAGDVVVEVRPRDGGSDVHVRSRSRTARLDFGANARRIRGYLDAMQ
jgi:hypothetical protein